MIGKFASPLAAHAAEHSPEAATLLEAGAATDCALVPFYKLSQRPATAAMLKATGSIGWKPPNNTGACSSNCMINELGRHIMRARFGYDLYHIIAAHEQRMNNTLGPSGEDDLDAGAVELGARLIGLSPDERRRWLLDAADGRPAGRRRTAAPTA